MCVRGEGSVELVFHGDRESSADGWCGWVPSNVECTERH